MKLHKENLKTCEIGETIFQFKYFYNVWARLLIMNMINSGFNLMLEDISINIEIQWRRVYGNWLGSSFFAIGWREKQHWKSK